MLDDLLLEVLACPRCPSRPPVRQAGDFLVCTECRCRYPVVDGIPQMLPESAMPPDEMGERQPEERGERGNDG